MGSGKRSRVGICFIIMFIMGGQEALLIRKSAAAADDQAGTYLSLSLLSGSGGKAKEDTSAAAF